MNFFSRWASSRVGLRLLCKLKRGASSGDGHLLEIKPIKLRFGALQYLYVNICTCSALTGKGSPEACQRDRKLLVDFSPQFHAIFRCWFHYLFTKCNQNIC